MKELHLLLIKSKPRKTLDDVLRQKNSFLKTLSGMTSEEQCQWIKDFLISNALITPFSKKTPKFFVLSDDAKAIVALNHPTKEIIDYMFFRLLECLFIQYYTYHYYKREELVLVFTYDKSKISKAIQSKIERQRQIENQMLRLYKKDL